MEKRSSVQWEGADNKPTTVPRKIATSSASKLGFWNMEPSNPLKSDSSVHDGAADLSDIDPFFTSTGNVLNTCDETLPGRLRLVVKEVRKETGSTTLVGNGVECHVSGEWSEVEYRVNSKVTVLQCMCCPGEEPPSGLEDLSELFESEDRCEGDYGGENISNLPDHSHKDPSPPKCRRHVFVSDTQNYLLVEDDPMTVTAFCGAISCINKPYISAKVADISFTHSSMSLLVGVVVHFIIEKALLHRDFSLDFLVQQARTAISENVVLMYTCNTDERTVLNETLKLLRSIHTFQDHGFEVVETEKRLVSLVFNVKGNADAIGTDMVLEVKSGRSPRIEHRAQAIMYSLILREKTGRDIKPYLYYVPSRSLMEVPLKHGEIRSLLNLRNKLALADGIQECSCEESEDCRVLFRIQRLDSGHFLRRQWEAIEREEEVRSVDRFVPAVFRYQRGNLVCLSLEDNPMSPKDVYLDLFNKEFIKLCKGIIEEVDRDRVMVRLSEEMPLRKQSKLYVSFGSSDIFFKFMRHSLIHVAYPRYMTTETCGGFVLPGEKTGLDALSDDTCSIPEELVFTDESNVSCNEDTGVRDISRIAMESPLSEHQVPIPETYRRDFLKLNNDQRSALFLSLNCRHYRIIHGMPGTGKTTLISLLIRILVHLKKKVLLICYTNLALTNIVSRLGKIKVYRAGKEEVTFKTTSELRSYFDSIELVVGTGFSFADPVYIDRRFDFCVVDEGSQLHLLLSLIPVSISSRFVIVGDHLQLKPLSKSSKDLSLSLFEYLLGEDHSKLRVQYRMGTEIMRLSNTLFYNNQLCGDQKPSTVQFLDTSSMDFPSFISSLANCTILCYFNVQVEFIRDKTRCPVETVDRFQGSEDDRIVVVFDPVSKCEVMESSERLNVALTRAKTHLTLVGHREKMMGIGILRSLLDILRA